MTIGITSSKFIKKMEKKSLKGDLDIIGITQNDFGSIVCSASSIEDSIKKLKKRKMSEFGLGWVGRMLMDMEIESRKQLSAAGIEIK